MSNREVVIRFPKAPGPDVVWTIPAPHPVDDSALALVCFLLDRLDEEPDRERAARVRALVDSWCAGNDREGEPEVEGWGETFAAWHRGFQGGILLALMVEASVYDDHHDWREEWVR